MLVNGVDISTYKAKLLSKDIQSAITVVYDDWLRQALNPLYLGRQITFKIIKLKFVVEDVTDNACLKDISNLVSLFKICVLKFDDIDFYYNCTISSTDHSRLITPGYFEVNIELQSGWAYLAEVTETMNHVLTKSINVLGNLSSPVKVTVTVPINTISLTITGFESLIVINDLLANVPVIIDGELCTVLQNGSNKFGDTIMWAFPVLIPGAQIISVDDANCVIDIKYKPKFM